MHDLPAHHGEEISENLVDHKIQLFLIRQKIESGVN